MSEVRFYIDEHVPLAISTGLRLRGVDVLTVQDAGLSGANDDAHLAFALTEKMVFTQDEDFFHWRQTELHTQALSMSHNKPLLAKSSEVCC